MRKQVKRTKKIPSWMKRLLLLKLNEIIGEIKAIYTRIDVVEKVIVSFKNETVSRSEPLDARFGSLEVGILARREMAKFEAILLDLEKN